MRLDDGHTGNGEIGPSDVEDDQDLNEATDDVTGKTVQVVRDHSAAKIQRIADKATIKAFMATPEGDVTHRQLVAYGQADRRMNGG